MKKDITREMIIECLERALEPLDFVNAMWQCGSKAFKRADDWSDVDVAIDVDDDKTIDVFKYTDEALKELSPIECTFESPNSMSPGAYQKVYKLKDASEFLVVEICAVKNSADDKFLQKEIHGNIIVSFDKKGVTEAQPVDKEVLVRTLQEKIKKIEQVFIIYQFLIKKELNRGNYAEAFAFYNGFSITPLLDLLRIEHSPYRHGFRSRYVYYDLPEETAKRLESYYFVKDADELRKKHSEIQEWFAETLERVKEMDIRSKL